MNAWPPTLRGITYGGDDKPEGSTADALTELLLARDAEVLAGVEVVRPPGQDVLVIGEAGG